MSAYTIFSLLNFLFNLISISIATNHVNYKTPGSAFPAHPDLMPSHHTMAWPNRNSRDDRVRALPQIPHRNSPPPRQTRIHTYALASSATACSSSSSSLDMCCSACNNRSLMQMSRPAPWRYNAAGASEWVVGQWREADLSCVRYWTWVGGCGRLVCSKVRKIRVSTCYVESRWRFWNAWGLVQCLDPKCFGVDVQGYKSSLSLMHFYLLNVIITGG